MKRRERDARGFTLLELIVAAGILALIAVFSWRGLDALVREREAIAASQATIDVVQRTFARIERDALLAADVQLDERALRLVAGTSSVDGAVGQNVEYRLADGTLTRIVAGVDRGALPMIDGIASLDIEAWAPSPQGGAWVRSTKPAAGVPAVVAPSASGGPVVYDGRYPYPGTSDAAQPTQGNTAVAAAAGSPVQPQQSARAVSAATGLRFTIALADGSKIVRSFIVGGG